jgi:small-conductance mechanosensitive channel
MWRRTWILMVVLVLIGVVLALGLDFSKTRLHLGTDYTHLIKALIILVVGGLISFILERYLFRMASQSGRRRSSLRFFTRLILLVVVVLSILAAFGVGISSVVFGGAFFTVILGLAGQTMFANLIAGIGLVIFRPFDVGERISFVAWQYPMLMPSYPHDIMKPGYHGIITDINLMYTTIHSQQGPPLMVPNGILIQALIENQSRSSHRRLRFRFDLPLHVPSKPVLETLDGILREAGHVGSAYVIDVAPTVYSVVVDFEYRGEIRNEDALRSEIFGQLLPHLVEVESSSS